MYAVILALLILSWTISTLETSSILHGFKLIWTMVRKTKKYLLNTLHSVMVDVAGDYPINESIEAVDATEHHQLFFWYWGVSRWWMNWLSWQLKMYTLFWQIKTIIDWFIQKHLKLYNFLYGAYWYTLWGTTIE